MIKSPEQRDEMVRRVQDAFAKWPTFDSMPVIDDALVLSVEVRGDPDDQRNYIAALYELCAGTDNRKGATPVGRWAGGAFVLGKG